MKILVTGSTGFIGRHLIPKLVLDGHVVLELTRDSKKSEALFGDITRKFEVTDDQLALTEMLTTFEPQVCIHLAAFLTSGDSYTDMQKLVDSNIVYLLRLLDALKQSKLELFVNTGSFAEYFGGGADLNPAYLYAATKSASRSFVDYYSKVYRFKQVTAVPSTIYGGKDSQKKIIDLIYDSLSTPTPLDLSPGEQVLDFVHVDDVVEFFMQLVRQSSVVRHGSVFKVGSGKGHTIKQLAHIIEQATGQKTNINWGGRPYRPTDLMYAVADLSANDPIGWQPQIDLGEGVKSYLSHNG